MLGKTCWIIHISKSAVVFQGLHWKISMIIARMVYQRTAQSELVSFLVNVVVAHVWVSCLMPLVPHDTRCIIPREYCKQNIQIFLILHSCCDYGFLIELNLQHDT